MCFYISIGQSCTDGFPTPEELRLKALEVNINSVAVRDRQQRVFPDITFICNGSISSVDHSPSTKATKRQDRIRSSLVIVGVP